MLVWLDNRVNVKRSPNENYGREVMELFTVGIGNYTESDIKQAARGFTGYGLSKEKTFVFNAAQHDTGQKTFMGETKNWDANDVLATLVRHPATARRLPEKMFRFFVHDSPDPATLDRLASTYVRSGFNVRAVMADVLGGPEFLSPQAYHGLVKQPVELVVGTLKTLNTQNVGRDATQTMRRMGQDLLNPPDVSGWAGGSNWINATTLFERFNFANRMATSRDSGKPYFTDIAGQVRARGMVSAAEIADYFLGLLVDGDVTPDGRQALLDYLNASGSFTPNDNTIDQRVRGMVHLTMATPTYQLA